MSLFKKIAYTALLLLVAACGREDNTTTLNRGLATDPESLDAHKSSSIQAADVLRDLGEGLVGFDAHGVLTPGVAESWAVSDDGLTYTFRLRDNARWSNGDAVTAAHFEFAFARLRAPETAAFYAELLAAVDTVVAANEQSLVITLKQPTPYLISLLTHPATFPMHPPSIEQYGDAFPRPGNLLSNGAYELVSWVPGSLIELKRNTHYWNNAATAIDTVRHHVTTQEATDLARYRAGEIDVTWSIPAGSIETIREEMGEQLHIAPYLGVYYYGYNLTKPPFQGSPEIRQALSMAIDRELLVKKVTGRGESPAYSWVPPGVNNYEPTVMSYATLTQDERNKIAKSLYKEAGYNAANPLKIELRYNTSDAQQHVALAIQSMWRDVLGAETTLINEEFQVLLANMRNRQITQVFRSSWIGDYNDAHTFLSVMQRDSAANMPGYANDEFESLMRRAELQNDLERRRYLLEEAERVMLADHPVIPIYFYVSKHLVSPRVEGWGDNVLDYHYSQHLSLKAAE